MFLLKWSGWTGLFRLWSSGGYTDLLAGMLAACFLIVTRILSFLERRVLVRQTFQSLSLEKKSKLAWCKAERTFFVSGFVPVLPSVMLNGHPDAASVWCVLGGLWLLALLLATPLRRRVNAYVKKQMLYRESLSSDTRE
jgi:hypothetical protein